MSYIDALFERDKDKIHVVERNNGVREYREFPASYVFYVDGVFISIILLHKNSRSNVGIDIKSE